MPVSTLVKVISAKTIDDYDGANDVIQNAFNRLYCSPSKVSLTDKKQYFKTLVSHFEVFLKKIYYLKTQEEIVSTKPGMEGTTATLADCIYQTPCLKRLKYADSDVDKVFSGYLGMVRDWRNNAVHKAPVTSESECDNAIKILSIMYLYVAAFGINDKDIQEACTELLPPKPYQLLEEEAPSIAEYDSQAASDEE